MRIPARSAGTGAAAAPRGRRDRWRRRADGSRSPATPPARWSRPRRNPAPRRTPAAPPRCGHAPSGTAAARNAGPRRATIRPSGRPLHRLTFGAKIAGERSQDQYGAPRDLGRPRMGRAHPKDRGRPTVKVIASSLRKGNIVELDGKLYVVLNAESFHPGKGTPTTQVDMRRISDGVKTAQRYKTTEQVERAYVEDREHQFLYQDGDGFHFMNTENYDQVT